MTTQNSKLHDLELPSDHPISWKLRPQTNRFSHRSHRINCLFSLGELKAGPAYLRFAGLPKYLWGHVDSYGLLTELSSNRIDCSSVGVTPELWRSLSARGFAQEREPQDWGSLLERTDVFLCHCVIFWRSALYLLLIPCESTGSFYKENWPVIPVWLFCLLLRVYVSFIPRGWAVGT